MAGQNVEKDDLSGARSACLDLAPYLPSAEAEPALAARGLSAIANGLVGSEILRIAAEIRALQAGGREVCNLTVGDFSPAEFRIPKRLLDLIGEALEHGETNYPPSDGILALREEVVSLYARELGVRYPLSSVLIAGGARPVIYAAFRAVLDPGETVVYPVPSWNNNHYAHLTGTRAVEVRTGAETGFLPTAEGLRPHLAGARLLSVNSPLNPAGSMLSREEVGRIASLVVEENRARERTGARPLYLLWDQVYWMLAIGHVAHCLPSALVPQVAPYVIYVDGISKAFAATGLRVGFAVAAPYVTARMRDILGHVGAWAPRPEQVATAAFLADRDAVASFREGMIRDVRARVDRIRTGLVALQKEGLPVECLEPEGGIYVAVRFDLIGKSRSGESKLVTNEDIRNLLLAEAGFAVVPFQAFGRQGEDGWMRLSVGAVSPAAIDAGIERVRALLHRVA